MTRGIALVGRGAVAVRFARGQANLNRSARIHARTAYPARQLAIGVLHARFNGATTAVGAKATIAWGRARPGRAIAVRPARGSAAAALLTDGEASRNRSSAQSKEPGRGVPCRLAWPSPS